MVLKLTKLLFFNFLFNFFLLLSRIRIQLLWFIFICFVLSPLIVKSRFWWHPVDNSASRASDGITGSERITHLTFASSTEEKAVKGIALVHVITCWADIELCISRYVLLESAEVACYLPKLFGKYMRGTFCFGACCLLACWDFGLFWRLRFLDLCWLG